MVLLIINLVLVLSYYNRKGLKKLRYYVLDSGGSSTEYPKK